MGKVSIVMYHYVRELKMSRFPEIKGLDVSLFRTQIEFLKTHFNIVRMEEVIAAFDGSYDLPQNSALLTFDDGYLDHYTSVFPILDEHGVQGSFSVPGKTFVDNALLDVNKVHFILASAPIELLIEDLKREFECFRAECAMGDYGSLFETYAVANRFDSREVIFFKRMLQTVLPEEVRSTISSRIFALRVGVSEEVFARELYLNVDQMKCMKKAGMFFCLHGYDHYWLGNLERVQMETDIRSALDSMEWVVDRNSWVMNYPYGSYNEDVIRFIEGSGCKLGLTTETRIADVSVDNRYKTPRLDTNDFPPVSNKYLNIC